MPFITNCARVLLSSHLIKVQFSPSPIHEGYSPTSPKVLHLPIWLMVQQFHSYGFGYIGYSCATRARWAPPPASDPIDPALYLCRSPLCLATSCPAYQGEADVQCRQSARNWLCRQVYTAGASCDAMCCINALADGAEGLHFSTF